MTTARCPAQTEVFGALNELMGDDDIVVNAAGSMPGDLQALWRARTPGQYHVEYALLTMGYEIPAALGGKMASPDSEVVAIVGDGTYQMLPRRSPRSCGGAKVIFVLLQNHGYASIGWLSESRGSQRFGTKYRIRAADGGRRRADPRRHRRQRPLLGPRRHRGRTIADFREAYATALASEQTTMIHIETDLYGPNPPATSWWDVPVTAASTLESTQKAYGTRRPSRPSAASSEPARERKE